MPGFRHGVMGLVCVLLIFLPLLPGEGRGEGVFSSPSADPTGAASISSQGLVPARPGYVYAFPRDHGSHDDYGLEWWYFTGHLYDQSARRFGYEVTFFRKAIDDVRVREHPSRWALRHLYFAHLALTDVERATFSFSEKFSRAAFGKAGADPGRMKVWIDRWNLEPVTEEHRQLRLTAHDASLGVDLTLTLNKPPVIHGREGISRKGANPGQASHYYSLTRLATRGTVRVRGEPFQVTGTSWMDHEFGSGSLGEDLVGWDWFSVQFDSNVEFMLYLLRKRDGSHDPASSGTLILPDGTSRHLTRADFVVRATDQWLSPHNRVQYPAKWIVEVPSVPLEVTITPVLPDQELRTENSTRVTYWEGAVDVRGHYRNMPVTGTGYVELTGYANPVGFDYHSRKPHLSR
ncbi:MAG: carotenoid 1,2-hydratase [Nitrospira sp.]|nr:carotenoid 1,2-hydratase [Nitrospira sp.]MDE0405331.1 carotenoid 1,2-hydratase [Nitrospira sp.]MDE0486522.1 carotenoid 1,2-hydratase [Nitrospira sp.]